MRIGIIGNSHVAALKFGLEELGADCAHEVVMWAMPGGRFSEKVNINDTSLAALPKVYESRPTAENDDETFFDGKNYDLVIIYGQSMQLERIARCLNAIQGYSSGFAAAYTNEITESRFAFRYARCLVANQIPVIIHAAPLFAEGFDSPFFFEIAVDDFLLEEAQKVGAHFMRQPDETISADGRTKGDFLQDNKHFDSSIRKNDLKHMNAEFGRQILLNIFSTL